MHQRGEGCVLQGGGGVGFLEEVAPKPKTKGKTCFQGTERGGQPHLRGQEDPRQSV